MTNDLEEIMALFQQEQQKQQQQPQQEEEDEDPILKARLDHALGPYEDLLPPEDLAAFREMLTMFLTTHPVATRLMDRLRARAVPASSGEVLGRDAAALAEAAARGAAGKRGAAR